MALIIEDGTGIADANSYGSVVDFQAYATARNITLPTDNAELEALLVNASDYLTSLEDRYQGWRVDATQALSFPRESVYIYRQLAASDEIPSQLINGQFQIAIDYNSGDLLPTGAGREVIMEKVDVIEVEYSETGQGAFVPVPTKALLTLKPLFDETALIHNIQVIR
jgi:hypothetical protein